MARKISYALFAGLAALVVWLHLGPALLAGLLSYMILDLTHRRLSGRLNETLARWLSIFIFAVTTAVLSWLFWIFLKLMLTRVPAILENAIPQIATFAGEYHIELPFGTFQDLRTWLIKALRGNAHSVTLESRAWTKTFFQGFLGMFVAVMRFLEGRRHPSPKGSLLEAVRREFGERASLFMHGFERVMGAQVAISAFNTLLTAVFLVAMGLPYFRFLTLSTFIFGMLPVIGNIISNTFIAGTALMLSPEHAILVLFALALIHKAEYLVNSHIIGSRVDLPTWQILFGILVGESLLGVPGIILAPAVITHIRKELQAIPYPAEKTP